MQKCRNLLLCVGSSMCLGIINGCSMLSSTQDPNQTISEVVFSKNEEKKEQYQSEDLRELLAMRNSLNRLVALESDLSYLLEEMSRIEDANPSFGFVEGQEKDNLGTNVSVFQSTEKSKQTNNDDELDKNLKLQLEKTPTEDLSKFFSQNDVRKPAAVVILPARKITAGSNNSSTVGVNTNKFSSQARVNATIRNTVPTDIHNSCASSKLSESGDYKFSVHLASYSSVAAAQRGKQELATMFDTKICPSESKVKLVSVKDKVFFSLRFGSYISKEVAERVCVDIRTHGQYCSVVLFEGDDL